MSYDKHFIKISTRVDSFSTTMDDLRIYFVDRQEIVLGMIVDAHVAMEAWSDSQMANMQAMLKPYLYWYVWMKFYHLA